MKQLALSPIVGVVLLIGLTSCTPKVQLEAPKEPITINLNIKLDAEVLIKLEKSAKDDIKKNPEIF